MILIRLAWATVGGVKAKEKSFRKDALVSPQPRRFRLYRSMLSSRRYPVPLHHGQVEAGGESG
jgi:hypothetical protein